MDTVESEAVTVNGIAEECYRKARKDINRAAQLMTQRLARDTELSRVLTPILVAKAIRAAVLLVMSNDRAAYNERTSTISTGRRDEARGLLAEELDTLLYPLEGGMLLGDAHLEDLQREVKAYSVRIESQRVTRDWLQAIADQLVARRKPRKAVREVFTSAELEGMKEGVK